MTMSTSGKTLRQRFQEKTQPEPNSGCLLWTGCDDGHGYGAFPIRQAGTWKAHQAAWLLAGRTVPAGMELCHKCDVRPCVNVDHLFTGTRQDNVNDMWRKGRGSRATNTGLCGEDHPGSKLTDAQVHEIRFKRVQGQTLKTLSKEYGVNIPSISLICNRKTWTHLVP